MPAVNLPLQLSSGNVTLKQVPKYQVRLLVCFTVAVLGLLLAALVLRPRRKYKFPPGTPPGQADKTVVDQHRLWLSEKSCGINASYNNMSSNHPSRDSPPRPDKDMEQEQQVDTISKEYRDHINGEGSQGGVSSSSSADTRMPRSHKSHPPPPPLTPPTLSTSPLSFQARRLSTAVSTMGDLEHNSSHHQNPDYALFSFSGSTSTALSNAHGSPSTPRRRSYTKTLPLGSSPSDLTIEGEGNASYFAPSSFPSSSPILPIAPHESFEPKEINLHGEIISGVNDSGAGWKRHTRVYGGGICPACMASGGNHDAQGGFYGENVPLDQRR
ncbi:hypothetical protein F4809DRAFT_646538 [Biscogniauxia mediterranea]|nr:hypothetical protein F4809DRAFT_646538 [Biscogniauxia mediterranea]